MKYSLDKYKFYQYKDKNAKDTVAAASTYAGRTVKGYAKCDPRDSFNVENGKKLAAARCNAKVSAKRMKRAEYKMKEAQALLDQAQAHYDKMVNYFNDASRDKSFAENEVNCLLKEM